MLHGHKRHGHAGHATDTRAPDTSTTDHDVRLEAPGRGIDGAYLSPLDLDSGYLRMTVKDSASGHRLPGHGLGGAYRLGHAVGRHKQSAVYHRLIHERELRLHLSGIE